MPIMPSDPASYTALTAMITPAIFLTANGSLIISTSNRMSRIVDRIRVLNDHGDDLCRGVDGRDYPELRLGHVEDQLARLVWRSDRIRYALAMLYLAFGGFVGSSLTLALDVWFHSKLKPIPTTLALLGVCLMLVASVNLVREAFEAIRSNRREIQFYRDLRDRRRADGAGCVAAIDGRVPALAAGPPGNGTAAPGAAEPGVGTAG